MIKKRIDFDSEISANDFLAYFIKSHSIWKLRMDVCVMFVVEQIEQ